MSETIRGSMSGDDCLKPVLTELKLEQPDSLLLPQHAGQGLQDMAGHQDPSQALAIARKSEAMRQVVAEHASSESIKLVDGILDQVGKLSSLDKLLLYLKLPGSRMSECVDPLRQPLNPLGSRSEIQLTINWIKTHLEEDPQVSLPKHEVYEEYIVYCTSNSVKPLSTADFGKVMKQVYPQVRPRRLGTRGNSRYCYAGLRKRAKLESPCTPDIGSEGRKEGGEEEDLSQAASFIIREWVEKLLGNKFDSLTELAFHLLEKMYVDNRSVAAFTLLSSAAKYSNGSGGGVGTKPNFGSPGVEEAKHKDAQLQLQRKLAERDLADSQQAQAQQEADLQQKRKLGVSELPGEYPGATLSMPGKRSKPDIVASLGELYCGSQEQEVPERFSVVVATSQAQEGPQAPQHFINGGAVPEGWEEHAPHLRQGQAEHPPHIRQTHTSISLDKLPRKKQAVVEAASLAAQSVVCLEAGVPVQLGQTSVIRAGEAARARVGLQSKYKDSESGWQVGPGDLREGGSEQGREPTGECYDEPADLSSSRGQAWEKLGESGGSSSDNHEEELTRYFSQAEVEGGRDTDKTEQLSQLRQLLEKNLKSPTLSGAVGAFKRAGVKDVASMEVSGPDTRDFPPMENSPIHPTTSVPSLSNRRRVSFNPLIVSDPTAISSATSHPSVAPVASPGSRRRHFSFQPISPRQSQPQSPPASPFISPRSTPVHMLRSRHSSGSGLPLHLLPGNTTGPAPGRQQHPSGSGSDISRAATFGSASESSTPFISPQSTPIPFNRSRHNSASALGATRHNSASSRSRHSSGLPGAASAATASYRYTTNCTSMPYSPMALNNLNNPFSPGPPTPAGCVEQGLPETGPTFPGPGGPQFVSPGAEPDPRSRHSSAGSDSASVTGGGGCPRSAPMSPCGGPGVPQAQHRQRHQSAGQIPAASHTIHYRPGLGPQWGQSAVNGDSQGGETEFSTDVSPMLPDVPERVYSYSVSGSQPATPSSGSQQQPSFTYHGGGIVATQPPSHQQTDNSQNRGFEHATEFGVERELESMVAEVGVPNPKKRNKDNDDLDLALDALRDCDTDFNKFVQETVNN